MRTFLLFVLLAASMPGFAQLNPKHKQDLIFVSYTAQQYFNKGNIEREGVGRNLSAKNTSGWNLGLAYQHITTFGLTLNYGLQLGEQTHSLSTFHDFSDYDPAASTLQGFTLTEKSDFKMHYFNQRFMLGYVKALPFGKGWAIEAKAGIGVKAYSKGTGIDSSKFGIIFYETDAGVITGRTYMKYEPHIGNNTSDYKWNLLSPGSNDFDHTWEVYLGLRKDIDLRYLRTINFGFEFTRARNIRSDFVTLRTYDKTKNMVNMETYYNKNISLGLYIAVGLWP